jgi:hypothetical protein
MNIKDAALLNFHYVILGQFISQVVGIMEMLIARTVRQELYTWLYGIYTLTKDEAMNFGTATVGLVGHAARRSCNSDRNYVCNYCC